MSRIPVGSVLCIEVYASDDAARADRFGHAIRRWEHVKPEDAGRYHLNNHSRRHCLERHRDVYASGALFYCPDVSLNLGDVFVSGNNIEFHTKGCPVPSHWFKFVVGMTADQLKPAFRVELLHVLEACNDRLQLAVFYYFQNPAFDMSRNCDEK